MKRAAGRASNVIMIVASMVENRVGSLNLGIEKFGRDVQQTCGLTGCWCGAI
jgi:hypothetical protein